MRETGTISSPTLDAVRDFDKILGVLLGNEHRFDTPTQGREQLLLETVDRPHAAAQRDLASHSEVAAHRNSGHHRHDRRDHGGAGGGSILRCRAVRHVDVDVVLIEQGRLDAEGECTRAHVSRRR